MQLRYFRLAGNPFRLDSHRPRQEKYPGLARKDSVLRVTSPQKIKNSLVVEIQSILDWSESINIVPDVRISSMRYQNFHELSIAPADSVMKRCTTSPRRNCIDINPRDGQERPRCLCVAVCDSLHDRCTCMISTPIQLGTASNQVRDDAGNSKGSSGNQWCPSVIVRKFS